MPLVTMDIATDGIFVWIMFRIGKFQPFICSRLADFNHFYVRAGRFQPFLTFMFVCFRLDRFLPF